jgi:hypothetical protein
MLLDSQQEPKLDAAPVPTAPVAAFMFKLGDFQISSCFF